MPLRKPADVARTGKAARTASPAKDSTSKLSKPAPTQDSATALSGALGTLTGTINEGTVSDAAVLGFIPGQGRGDPMTAHQNLPKATDSAADKAIEQWVQAQNWQRVKQAQIDYQKEEFVTVKKGADAVTAGYTALSSIEKAKQSVIEWKVQTEKTAQNLDSLGLEVFRTGENRKQIISQKAELGFNTEIASHRATIARSKAQEIKEKAEALMTIARPA
jgi:hypothetical protein